MTSAAYLRVVAPDDLPPPFLPADVDLRDLPEAMINIQWLCDSRFAYTATPEEFGAAVRLQARAIHELPAATLPDDDVELAFLAGYGRDLAGWQRARPRALEGWTLRSDGRLGRRDLALKALDIWLKRLAHRRKSAAGVAKRRKIVFVADPYDKAIQEAVSALYTLDPQSPVLRHYLNPTPAIAEADELPGDVHDDLPDDADASTSDDPCLADHEPTSGSTSGHTPGTTKGRDAKRRDAIHESAQSADARARDGTEPRSSERDRGHAPIETIDEWPRNGFDLFWQAWPGERVNRGHAEKAFKRVARERRVPFAELLAGLERYRLGKPPDRPWRNPATWLNGRGWEDEWGPPRPPPGLPPGPPRDGGAPSRPMGGVASAMAGISRALTRPDGGRHEPSG